MLYLVDLEPVDTRYTSQWRKYLPDQFANAGISTTVISGGTVAQTVTPGAFLNFSATNSYKSEQLKRISFLFQTGEIKDGDYFLYTDAWNPTVIQLKYMAELLGIKIKIGGMWHAGSYDPQDFLGRLIGDVPWVRNAESAMFHCYDHNFFATEFHLKMFLKELFDETDIAKWKEYYPGTLVVGWPMEYMYELLAPYMVIPKKDRVIFPHRLAPEKQPEIFEDLALNMPDVEFFFAQKQRLTKNEYHRHLASSKIVFSANLQETLGISVYEGASMGVFPLMPDRLSYSEMWPKSSLYPSLWTKDFDSYQRHKKKLIKVIRGILDAYSEENMTKMIYECRVISEKVGEKYFNGSALYKTIIDSQV